MSLQTQAAEADTLFVYLTNGGIDAFPMTLVSTTAQQGNSHIITTIDGKPHTYSQAAIDRLSTDAPTSLAGFVSLKFNDKFNPQLPEEVKATIANGTITATVGGIGRWLTPSFTLTDNAATAYIDGVAQESKVTRNSYKNDVTFTVALPGHRVLTDGDTWMPYGTRYTTRVDFLVDHDDCYVPRIYIITATGEMISSKTTYLDATITVDGGGVYPSMTGEVKVKGRGNSSWDANNPYAKNPYRLKFSAKQSVLGLKKGKNWVLQANAMNGSMMTNALGMKIANLVETAASNHVIPVELYINDDYRGSYNLTEKVGFSANSVDLDDETYAVLLELDTYYDEDYKFTSSPYTLPVNIKEPDLSDDAPALSLQVIRDDFNYFMSNVKNSYRIAEFVDVDHLARYLMVNELIMNYELSWPKSVFLYRENMNDAAGKYIFGPVWDLDWAFGYNNGNYLTRSALSDYWGTMASVSLNGAKFFTDLRNNLGDDYNRAAVAVWDKFMTGGGIDELLDYCNDYYAFAAPSFEHNNTKWRAVNYATLMPRMKQWLQQRAESIYEGLPEVEPDQPISTGVRTVTAAQNTPSTVDVYSVSGICLKRNVTPEQATAGLAPGIYIIAGKKVAVSPSR